MTEIDVYSNGVASLEEWEDIIYCDHSFMFKEEYLTDKEVVDLLYELNKENEELKQFKEKVFGLLDEKIKYYMKQPCLAVRLPIDCEYRHSCLHNNSVNVCNKAKENAYRELEKIIQDIEEHLFSQVNNSNY